MKKKRKTSVPVQNRTVRPHRSSPWSRIVPALLALFSLMGIYAVYYGRYVILWDDFTYEFLPHSYFINHWLRFGELPQNYFYTYCVQPIWPFRYGFFYGLPILPIAYLLSFFHSQSIFFLYDVYVLSFLCMQLFAMVGCFLVASQFLKHPASTFLVAAAYAIPEFWTQLPYLCHISPYIPWFLYFLIRLSKTPTVMDLIALMVFSVCAFFSYATYAFFAQFYLLMGLAVAWGLNEAGGGLYRGWREGFGQAARDFWRTKREDIYAFGHALWRECRIKPGWLAAGLLIVACGIGVMYTYVHEQEKIYNYERDYFLQAPKAVEIKASTFAETFALLSIGARPVRSIRSGFIGTTVILLAAAGLFTWRQRSTRIMGMTILFLMFLYCTPWGSEFIRLLFRLFPFLSLFNRFLVVLAGVRLLLAILAARGMEHILELLVTGSKKVLDGEEWLATFKSLAPVILTVLAVGLLSSLYLYQIDKLPGNPLYSVIMTAAALGVLGGAGLRLWNVRVTATLLCALVFGEIAYYDHRELVVVSRDQVPAGQKAMLETILSRKPYTLKFEPIFPNFPGYKSRETVQGESKADDYPPTPYLIDFYAYDVCANAFQGHVTLPKWTTWIAKQMHRDYYDLLDAIENNASAFKELWDLAASDNARMVTFYRDAYAVENREAMRQVLHDFWFTFDTLVLLSPAGEPKYAQWQRISPSEYNPEKHMHSTSPVGLEEGLIHANEINVTVNSREAGFLVFLVNYGHGWEAKVNEKPADVETAFGVFTAVEIPAGVSHIHLRNRPLWGGYYTRLMQGFFYGMVGLGLWTAFGYYWTSWKRIRSAEAFD